jgi:alpha-tubulin suppressor-like RCC1 family protein
MKRKASGTRRKRFWTVLFSLCLWVPLFAQGGGGWGWGDNRYGQLGDGSPLTCVPGQTVNLAGVRSIAGGYWHSLALKDDGTVWAWGYNGNGQLGNGTTPTATFPLRFQPSREAWPSRRVTVIPSP